VIVSLIVPLTALFVMLGMAAGALHFLAISRDAKALVSGRSGLAESGLRLGRMLVTIAVLTTAARQGWPVLLGATAGFMAARQIVLHKLRAAPW
jgi:F1F0 ATPase subunit 2